MKLSCSRCNAESEQPVQERSGSHYEYVCENKECGTVLQGDFKGVMGPIGRCEHPKRKKLMAAIFRVTSPSAKVKKKVTGKPGIAKRTNKVPK
jgi:hypothetical protein